MSMSGKYSQTLTTRDFNARDIRLFPHTAKCISYAISFKRHDTLDSPLCNVDGPFRPVHSRVYCAFEHRAVSSKDAFIDSVLSTLTLEDKAAR